MMFESYVVHQRRPFGRFSVFLLAGAILVATVAVVLVIMSFFQVLEVPPPPLTVTFFSAAAPPPPPPPPPPPKKSSTPKTPKPTQQIVQPTEIKPLIQPKEQEKKEPEPDEDDGQDDGVEGGVEGGVKGGVAGGVVGGVVGGVLGGTGTAPPPPPPAKPKNVPPHQLDTEAIFKPDPHLPDAIKIQRKGMGDATFTAKICVDQEGKVFQVNVLASIPGADEGIIATLKTWRFKPQPIPICSVANWVFTIN